jgi:protease I
LHLPFGHFCFFCFLLYLLLIYFLVTEKFPDIIITMSKVLLVMPHDRFRDEEYKAVTETLNNEGHEVAIGSSHHSEAQGLFGMLVKPDVNVSFVESTDYDAVIFIGGHGIDEYINNSAVLMLVRNYFSENKVIGALGRAVEILAYSGVISGRKVTCDISTITKVQSSGAYYTGRLVEKDGNLITGTGVEASQEFAESVLYILNPGNPRGGLYARTS